MQHLEYPGDFDQVDHPIIANPTEQQFNKLKRLVEIAATMTWIASFRQFDIENTE